MTLAQDGITALRLGMFRCVRPTGMALQAD